MIYSKWNDFGYHHVVYKSRVALSSTCLLAQDSVRKSVSYGSPGGLQFNLQSIISPAAMCCRNRLAQSRVEKNWLGCRSETFTEVSTFGA